MIIKPQPRWHQRVREIECDIKSIDFPHAEDVAQDEEHCIVVVNGDKRKIRFHDYHEVYDIPGLYERLFYTELKCCSPSRTVGLLEDVLGDHGQSIADLRVFDVGAGNGMVGDELDARGCEVVVGADIIQEAKHATLRDRPGVYTDYCVCDLTDLDEATEEKLRKHNFNAMTLVAALGFGDIPPKAFIKALDLVETSGWIAFNIKEDFAHDRDDSGFCKLIRQLTRENIIQPQAYRRYRHRISATGTPLHYLAMVTRKLKDIPDHLLNSAFAE